MCLAHVCLVIQLDSVMSLILGLAISGHLVSFFVIRVSMVQKCCTIIVNVTQPVGSKYLLLVYVVTVSRPVIGQLSPVPCSYWLVMTTPTYLCTWNLAAHMAQQVIIVSQYNIQYQQQNHIFFRVNIFETMFLTFLVDLN